MASRPELMWAVSFKKKTKLILNQAPSTLLAHEILQVFEREMCKTLVLTEAMVSNFTAVIAIRIEDLTY